MTASMISLPTPHSARRWISRALSGSTNRNKGSSSFIEDWQASIVRPTSFYESNSAPGLKRKNYFYNIDLQGRVFLEETLPKNIATSIKSTEFLNFFFQRLRRVGPKQGEVLQQLDAEEDYPFVSPCGPELNFVRPADLPIVFHSIRDSGDHAEKALVFAGSLSQPFRPEKLAISPTTGRLYHELICNTEDEVDGGKTSSKRSGKLLAALTPLHTSERVEYGLIRSSVAVSLADSIGVGSSEAERGTSSGMEFYCPASDCSFSIKWLPLDSQPGPWSMPHME